jgi:hypothetical protein
VKRERQFERLADLVKAAGPRTVVRRIVVRDAKGRRRYRYVEVKHARNRKPNRDE